MHGVDAAGQPVVRHARHLGGLHVGEHRVGGHNCQGRVLTEAAVFEAGALRDLGGRAQETAAGRPQPGHDGAARHVQDIAERIDGHQGAHRRSVGQAHGGRAQATLGGPFHAAELAHRGAGAGAHTAFGHRPRAGRLAGREALPRTRPHVGAAHAQVEEGSRGHDGHARHAQVHAVAAALQPLGHAVGDRQAESAAAGDHDGVRNVHQVHRVQRVGLASGRRRAAHIHRGGDALRAEHHRASGGGLKIGPVAHAQALDRRQGGVIGGRRIHAQNHTTAARSGPVARRIRC